MKSTKIPNFELPNLWAREWGIVRQEFLLATCFLLLISFSGLYLFLYPDLASQPWDSLEYGYSTELNGIKVMRGNHPLGHAIFFAIFSLAKQLGYNGRALPIFQISNGILGGIAIAIFFTTLVSLIKVRTQYALGFSLITGASYSFWFFAGTGDIYHLSILFSLLAWAALVYEITLENRSFPFLSGLLAGLSILFHQLNIVLVPVGLALILSTPASGNETKKLKIKKNAVFIATLSITTVLGYLMLGFIATSSLSPSRIIGWMQGYFGDSTYGRYLTVEYFKTAWTTISQAVLFSPRNTYELISHGLLAFFFLVMFVGLLANKALDKRKQAIMIASALECLITWPLILWWEPQNPKFWLLTLVPWMIILALSFEAVEIRMRNLLPRFSNQLSSTAKALPLLIGFVLFSINIQSLGSRPEAAAFDEAMDIWMINSSPNDVLITVGDLIPHLRYWGKRPNTVFLYRSLQASQASPDGFYKLRAVINQALCANHTVLITPTASEYVFDSQLSIVDVSREDLRAYLDEIALEGKIVFWYRNVWDGKLLPVYALRGSGTCSE